MPWCDACTRFYNPTSMGSGGECPSCGRVIAAPAKVPWHFWVLVAMASVYLAWRGVQALGWVVERLG